MSSLYEYEIHPAALLFPMLAEKELAELADDIKANKQQERITLCKGLLLDGRNRLEACKRSGVEPQFQELEDGKDPWKYAVSRNILRRNLTPALRAKLALDCIEPMKAEAKERQKASGGDRKSSKTKARSVPDNCPEPIRQGESRNKAGALVGLCGKAIDQYAKVRKSGTPALLAMVDASQVGIHSASLVAELPKEKQAELTSDPKKVKNAASKIRSEKKKEVSKTESFEEEDFPSQDEFIAEAISRCFSGFAEDGLLGVADELIQQKSPLVGAILKRSKITVGTNDDVELSLQDDVDTFKLNGGATDPVKALERIFETSSKEMKQRLHERCGVLWNAAKKNSPYSVDFEKFWLAYPAKGRVNKGKAWECWSKALGRLENVELCQLEDTWSGFLVRRAKEYSDSPRGQSEFCKHATTWLNGDAWTDSVESWMDDGTRVRTKSGLRDRAGDHLPKGRGSLCAPGVEVAEEEMSEEEELQHRSQMDKLFKGK